MHDLAPRFMALFAGLDRAYGIYEIKGRAATGKKTGQARTLQEPVTLELWERHLRAEIQLGIVPIRDDATCVFGAIDIDDYKLDHKLLESKIKKQKLPLVMCRSKSGGAHLYAFLATATPASDVRELLSDWAALLGYGNVEIFPKQSKLHSGADTGNWINVPYCGGDESERYAINDGERLTAEDFLAHVVKHKVTRRHFTKTQQAVPDALEDGPPCLIALCSSGFPEGTRNSGLFALGVYARRRWGADWEQQLVSLNARYMNPPLDDGEVTQVIAHLQRKEYSYTCKTPPLVNLCQRAVCIKRKYGIGPADAQETFGIQIENVIRLEVDPVAYFADLNGKRIHFGAEHINSQHAFRETVINQVGEVIQPVPTGKWFQYMAKLCSGAAVVAAPAETAVKSQLIALVEDYCLEQVPGRSWEDVIDGQTYEENGRVYFRPHKFVNAINKEHHLRYTVTDAYKALMAFDVRSDKRQIGGKEFAVWSVPQFKRADRSNREDM